MTGCFPDEPPDPHVDARSQARRYCQAEGKRLPTEAEWELAARGGMEHRFPWGHEEPRCDEVIFARDEGRECARQEPGPADVGTARQDRSRHGILDLGGNVGEWVQDRFMDRYPACGPPCVDPVVDGAGPGDAAGEQRVIRGGDWHMPAPYVRSAGRSRYRPQATLRDVGFRCVRPARRAEPDTAR